jgi:hypothetical protein
MGDLRRGVNREVASERLGHHQDAAGLHRRGDQSLLNVASRHGVGRFGEGPFDGVPVRLKLPRVAPVGPQIVMDHHSVRQGVFQINDDRQWVVLQHHSFGCVVRLILGAGQHDGDRLSYVTHFLHRNRQVSRRSHVLGNGPYAR